MTEEENIRSCFSCGGRQAGTGESVPDSGRHEHQEYDGRDRPRVPHQERQET